MTSPSNGLDATGQLSLLVEEELAGAIGAEAAVTVSFGRVVVTVAAQDWIPALTAARDRLGADFFDWLTGVDELAEGFTVAAFVCSATGSPLSSPVSSPGAESGRLARGQGLILKTALPRERPELPTATSVYRGADWHERETFEMFGIVFTGHPNLKPLLLPDGFEGTPLRKDFVLAARVAKAWPGAKEPGESDRAPSGGAKASPGRRRMLPPGVPGEEWLKPLPTRVPDEDPAADIDEADGAGDAT
jgi:NADH-quinone oxidoreductase subunit C